MLRPEKWQNHHDRQVKEPDSELGILSFAHTPVWLRSRLLQSGEAWGMCLRKHVRSCWSELSFRSVAPGKVHSTLRPPQLPPGPGPPRLPVQTSFSGMLGQLGRFLEGLLTALFPASFIRFEAEVSSFINRGYWLLETISEHLQCSKHRVLGIQQRWVPSAGPNGAFILKGRVGRVRGRKPE